MLTRGTAARVADEVTAARFSVETLWDGHTVPVGAHKPWLYLNGTQLAHLYALCPELHAVHPIQDFTKPPRP
jgi:hypothetical protein